MEQLNMNNNDIVYTGETKNIKKAFDHLQSFLNTRHSKLTVDELYGEITRGTKGVDGLAARRILAGKEKDYFDINSWMHRVENEIVPYKAMLHYLEDLYLDANLSENDWDRMFEAMGQLKNPADRLEGGEELWEGGFEGIFSFLLDSLRKNFVESGVSEQYASETFLRENMLHFNKAFFLDYFAPALELDANSLNLILTKVLGEYQIDYYDKDQFLLYLAMELFVNHTGFGFQSEYQLLQELKARYDRVKPKSTDFLKEYSKSYSQDTRYVADWMNDRLREISPAGPEELDEILKKHKATFSVERKRTAEKYYEDLWKEVCKYYRADVNAFYESDEEGKMALKMGNNAEKKWAVEIGYDPGSSVVIPDKSRFFCETEKREGKKTIYLEAYEKTVFEAKDLPEVMVKVKAETERPSDDVIVPTGNGRKRKRGECFPSGMEIPVPEDLKELGVCRIVTAEKVKVYSDKIDKGSVTMFCKPGTVIPADSEFCVEHTYTSKGEEKKICLKYRILKETPAGNFIKGTLGLQLCKESENDFEMKNGYCVYAETNSRIECEEKIEGLRMITSGGHRLQVSPNADSQEGGKRVAADYAAKVQVRTVKSSYEGDRVNIKNNTRLRVLNMEELEQAGYKGLEEIYADRAVKQKVSDQDKGELEIRCRSRISFPKGTLFRCMLEGVMYEFQSTKTAVAVEPHETAVKNPMSEQEERERLIRYLYHYEEDDAGNLASGELEPELWDKVMGGAILEAGETCAYAGRNIRNQLLTLCFLKFVFVNREKCGDKRMVIDEFIEEADKLMVSARLPMFYLRNPLDCIFTYFLCFDAPLTAYRINWSQYLYYKNKEKQHDKR